MSTFSRIPANNELSDHSSDGEVFKTSRINPKTAVATRQPDSDSENLPVVEEESASVLSWPWAMKLEIGSMSRVEAYKQFWKPCGGTFSDWVHIYPKLKENQLKRARWETWVLDPANLEFKILEDRGDEKEKEKEAQTAGGCPTVLLKDAGDDVFWYFWDYDTGMKKRMMGIAARQIECGYQWIKKHDYEVDPALRSGVKATQGVYRKMNTKYKLSYQVTDAAQKDKHHIAVYQINVHTGFQRLLERYPPETTAAKIRGGSFMDVYLLHKQSKDTSTIIDFWIKGGRTHFQQVWIPTVIRFEIDTPLAQNRKAQEKEILDLWREKKLVGVGHNANVEIKQDARHMRQFVLSLNDEKLGEMRDARSSKIAMMNYMDAVWREKMVSVEVALSSTKEHFGNHFYTVFASEAKFCDQFLRQYNENCVLWYTHIPFDLIDVMKRAENLFARVTKGQEDFSLSYIFDPLNKKKTTFAAVDCAGMTGGSRPFDNSRFMESDEEADRHFTEKVTRHRDEFMQRSRLYNVSNVGDILMEDAIFDTAIKSTREVEHRLILTVFPFDRDHLYAFRNGAVVRVKRPNVNKFLTKIAHIHEGRTINDMKILSVETFADGSVQYGCQDLKDTTSETTLTRKRLHQIMALGDEKELETPLPDDETATEVEVEDKLEEKEKDNAVWRSLESLEDQIERFGEALKSFFYIDDQTKGRRADGHVIKEFIAHAVDDRNSVFPTVAVFKELPSNSREEIKKLYSVENWRVDMTRVFACAISCYNERAVLGVVEMETMAHFFRIDVGTKNVGDMGLVSAELAALQLTPQAILSKANRKICFASHLIPEAELEYNIRDQNIAEQLSVKFAECRVLDNIFQDEPLQMIEARIKELHEWSNGRRRVGRIGTFAVYLAQSTTFEYLRTRLKVTKQNERNPEYDEYMELLANWDIAKWKNFTDNGFEQAHPNDVFVMIIDHAVYTFRRIRSAGKDKLKQEIETAYGIDAVSAANSFVYHDSDELNIREECTSRGLYVDMPICNLPELTCPVCYDAKDSLSTLSCGHSFCHQCIRQQLFADNNNCAICRHNIMRPYMIPRPNQVTKEFAQKHYGPGYQRAMQYRSFADDVEWNTCYAQRGEQRNDNGGNGAPVSAQP